MAAQSVGLQGLVQELGLVMVAAGGGRPAPRVGKGRVL